MAFTEEPQGLATAPELEAAVETIGDPEATPVAEDAIGVTVEPEIVAESHVAAEESFAAVEESLAEPAATAEITDEFSLDAAAEAEDDAVLAAIAMEMAAPDPDFDEIVEPVEMAAEIPEPVAAQTAAPVVAEVPEPIAAEPAVAARMEEPVIEAPIAMESLARLTDAIAEAAAEVMEQPAMTMAATATFGGAPAATLPMPSPMPEASLGASILASGILQKPRTPANDALAPIRRMTPSREDRVLLVSGARSSCNHLCS